MTAFHPDLPARTVDQHLREALEELRRAEKNAVLWFAEIMKRALFRELGYSSINQYAELALGFKKAKTSQFIRLSRAIEDLPALKQSLAENTITWTKAREVTKVASRKTEKAWIREAKNSSRRELEQKIQTARKLSKQVRGQSKGQTTVLASESIDPCLIREVPIEVRFRMMPEQFARYEAMTEKLRKLGVKGSIEELIIAAMEVLVGEAGAQKRTGADEGGSASKGRAEITGVGEIKGGGESGCGGVRKPAGGALDHAIHTSDPRFESFTRVNGRKAIRKSPYQVIVNACPSCGGASVETSRGAPSISQATLLTALCDAQIKKKGGKNRATIPPSIRMEVMMRDRHRCQAKGCERSRFLNVHHIIPREKGGANELDNLITLCWGCHHTLHELAERGGHPNPESRGGRLMAR